MILRAHLYTLQRGALASALAIILLNGNISVAHAQQEEDEDTDDAELPGDEVVVTGTRIRRDDFSSPNATTVVTAEDMDNLGVSNVADMLSQMPNNIGSVTPEANTDSAFNVGESIANLRGLNTSTGSRTLTLVDSRRMISSNNGGGVDMNLIPSALVGRVETVTGGASATYGADAMAGAVNVILDHELQGTRVNVSYGATGEGDGQNTDFSLATGTEVFNGRGHVTVGVEHSNQDGINDCTTRDYCRRSMGYFQNGEATAAGPFSPPPPPYSERSDIIFQGQPQYVITDGMRFTNLTTGILMGVDGDPQIWTFNEQGDDLEPIYNDLSEQERALLVENGVAPWNGVSPYGQGSLQYANVPLSPERERNNIYSRFAYELDSGIELTSEFSYSESEALQIQDSFRNSYNDICLRSDNAYVLRGSQQLQDQIAARATGPAVQPGTYGCTGAPYLGGTFAQLGVVDGSASGTTVTKDLSGQIDRENNRETSVTRFVIGANGDLFSGGSWTWDTHFQYSTTDRDQSISDYPTETRQAMAKDAVIDPVTDEIVCRVNANGAVGQQNRDKWRTYFREALGDDRDNIDALVEDYLVSLSDGCAPINFFGHAMSEEAKAYAYDSIVEGADITQRAASLSFSGNAWSGIGAGPLAMAAGIDSRQETTRNYTGDDPITARDFTLNYGDAWAGRTTNVEGFVEFEMPLLRDKPAADYLMLNLANRRTQNKTDRLTSDPLSVTRYQSSWKASMVWQPLDIMRVRTTRSSDTRAPAPRELYQTNTAAATASGGNEVDNPFREDLDETPNLNDVYDRYQEQSGGNADLGEEVSISETFGLVFTPGGALEGLQASVDYYETTITGGIQTVGATEALQRCYQEVQQGLPEEERTYCVNNVVFGPPEPQFEGMEGYEYSNVLTLSSSQENEEPFWSRGLDFSVSYFTQLSEGGTLQARFFGTKFLEQSVDLGSDFGRRDVSGQTGSNGLGNIFGSFGYNYSPTPEFSGNMFMTYTKNAFRVTGQVRYTGSGELNLQDGWIGPGETGSYVNSEGETVSVPYAPNLDRTVSGGDLPSWATLNVNFGYDFGRSQMALNRFENLSVYLNITNIGDRVPDFFSGTGAGGINTTYYSGMGREYELGLRMQF